MKNCLLVLMLFIANTICAQYHNGYIITLSQDTLYGKIHEKSGLYNKNLCLVKLPDKNKKSFSSDEILGFYSDKSGTFSSQKIKNAFVQDIVNGKLSLYKTIGFKPKYLFQKDSLLLLPTIANDDFVFYESGKNIIKYDHKIPTTLTFLTQECKDINIPNSIKKNDYAVAEWVMKYNQCMGHQSTFVLPTKKKIVLRAFAKYEFSSIATDFIYKIDNGSDGVSPISTPYNHTFADKNYGIGLEIHSPILNNNIYFQVEFNREKCIFEANSEQEFTTGIRYNSYKMNQTMYHIPVIVKLKVLTLPMEVFVEGGYSLSLNQFSESYLSSAFVANPPFQSSKKEGIQDLVFRKNYTGINIGLSAERKIFNNISIGGFYRYRYMNSGESGVVNRVIQINNINSFGIYLKY